MKTFSSIDDILDFAMKSEQEAIDFYQHMSAVLQNPEMKELFLEFAREEVGHKARLKKIKDEKVFDMTPERVNDLKIADYVVSEAKKDNLEYQDALIIAMKREKAAFKLYTRLASCTDNPDLKNIFQALATEESKHKLRFEIEYDEYVLREN